MTDCTHVFAECEDECTSPTQRLASDMNSSQRAAMAEFNWIRAIGAGVAVFISTMAVLYCVAAVVERGAENIRQTQIQNEAQ